MQSCFDHIALLTSQSDIVTLVQRYCEIVEQQFKLKQVILLQSSADGRSLQCAAGGNSHPFNWQVNDFTTPFAHAIQQQKTICLNYRDRLFWQDNPELISFFETLAPPHSLLITPLMVDSTPLLLVLIAEETTCQTITALTDFQLINQLLLNQWRLLRQLSLKDQQALQLNRSLAELHQKKQVIQLEKKLIGHSRSMVALRDKIIHVAQSPLSVLILGETGTGKELVAKALHDHSSRHRHPFVAINCITIPENLLESELFGYEKGAFSGADQKKAGLIQAANQGTLFLDEIGDMPLALQGKLLRVLETQYFRPLGAQQEVSVNFRLLAATHVDLRQKIQQGKFRQDLFYRLNQFPIKVPALRERKEDLPELIEHFRSLFSYGESHALADIDPLFLTRLNQYDFPGNVRELKNLIERACVPHLEFDDIELSNDQNEPINTASPTMPLESISDLRAALQQFEATVIRSRLHHFKGNREKVAKSLGLPRRTLTYRCSKLGID